ncbi:hypothetical protein BASA81_006758 [Batrachochytrium salamandrivorans]|nr:hypothetical protein BASA81_006758 [Batrachochytrium salamandrivorans]
MPRVREVETRGGDTAATFLAEFHSAVASLEPDERIKLKVSLHDENNIEWVKAAFADQHATKICSLLWIYDGEEDVSSVIPLLTKNCPELGLLEVRLKRPNVKVKALDVLECDVADLLRFFVALGQSRVSTITIRGYESYARGLYEYLASDLLVTFKVWMNQEQVSFEMLVLLANCACLSELLLFRCHFHQPAVFTCLPKSIIRLEFCTCRFAAGVDWSFLVGSSVRKLDFFGVQGVDGSLLGRALAVQLGAKGLDKMRFYTCDFIDETLAAIGVEIGRIKTLHVEDSHLGNISIELIALALQSPNNEMTNLGLWYSNQTMSSIENHLVPALRRPNCNLAKLRLLACQPEYEVRTDKVEMEFYNRRALFALLQGQQQGQQMRRRQQCQLRRLPMEMFRLVGGMLS